MEYLSGKPVSDQIKEQIKLKTATLNRKPSLVILLNSEDESSKGYSSSLVKNASSIGIDVKIVEMEQDETVYLKMINLLNKDDNVDSVLITRPLNKNLDEQKIINALSYEKDVDALNPLALGLIGAGEELYVPNTAMAIIKMIEFYNIQLQGKKVLVIGRSLSVGKPVALLLMNRNATVTIAHSKTKNLQEELKNYDIVVAAIGKPQFIKGNMMKEGAIVIDAGIHYLSDGIVGDVEPSDNLSYISKVPGGVGLVTTACLMESVLKAYMRK